MAAFTAGPQHVVDGVDYVEDVSFFNTAGPCDPAKHYMVPAAERLSDVSALIERELYLVVHAPRQTGKTTAIRALAKELTASGEYAALAFSCQAAGPAQDDYVAAQDAILGAIRQRALIDLPEELRPPAWPESAALMKINTGLSAWAQACPRPIVLFMDEIDSVIGTSLISVLRQIRDGYEIRPEAFPSSIVLCGLRDVRDYKAASGGDPTRLSSASPFNIKAESLRLGNFTRDDIAELCGQHTRDTGQEFTPQALDAVYEATAGQPWLVNALADEMTASFKMAVPPSEPVTAEHVAVARERLIRARATHLDSLVDKLREPRVKRIIEPLIAGGFTAAGGEYNDDLSYVTDLGLVARLGSSRRPGGTARRTRTSSKGAVSTRMVKGSHMPVSDSMTSRSGLPSTMATCTCGSWVMTSTLPLLRALTRASSSGKSTISSSST
jgi:hypothetical protein